MSQDYHTRKLGFLEKYYVCRNVEQYSKDINVTGQYNHYIDKVLLSNALRTLILKNPSLAVNIYRDGDLKYDEKLNGENFTVRPVEKIAFNDVVTFETIEEPFGELLLKRLNGEASHVNDSKPLWRIKVFESTSDRKQYVSFHCDHTLFDGSSATQFHKDLIVELAYHSKDQSLEIQETLFIYTADWELLPHLLDSSDKIVDLYNPSILLTLLEFVLKILLPKWLYDGFWSLFSTNVEQAPLYTHNTTRKEAESNIRHINITPKDVKRLRAFCKSQNTTLTPFIAAIATYALQETVFPAVAKHPCSCEISIPIDGRRYFPEKIEDTKYGLYMGVLSNKVAPITDIASSTNSLTANLTAGVADKSPFSFVGLLKYVNYWKFLADKLGKTDSRLTLEVSNLGLHLISHNDWSIDNIWFSQANGILTHFCLSVIATESSGLNLLASYFAELDLVQTSLGKLVIDEFMALFSAKLLENV